jgi:eukaryotic-like serine/threonine-protein kinase
LGDFGLARALVDEEGEETLTHTGHILGTPEYMAPEQLFGKPVTSAADIYSLGLVIYEMVTGARAFPGSRGLGNAMRRATEKPESPCTLAPELPEHWGGVILECLDTDPDRRPRSAEAVTTALLGNPAMTQSVVAAPPRPRRVWAWVLAAAMLTMALSFITAPVRNFFGGSKSPAAASHSTHDDYLKAVDLLSHSYRPKSVETALAILEKTVASDPEFALAHAALGQAYWLSHRERDNPPFVDKARASCAKAITLDNRLAPPHVTLGRIYTESNQAALAAQELQVALKLDPTSAEAYGAQAELFQRQGRNSEVEPALQKAIDLAPDDWRWPNLLGIYFRSIGQFDRAAQQFEKLAGIAPDNAIALNNLGGTYMRLGRLDSAREAFEKSLRVSRRPTTLDSLSAVLLFQGKTSEAIEISRQAVEAYPESHRSWGNLAAAYLWSGDKREALANYRKATEAGEKMRKTNPNNAQLLADLAGYYAELSDASISVPLLRQAAIRDPKNPNVLFRIGETYEVLNQRALALEFIGKALERGYPAEFVRRNPELRNLLADPKFKSPSAR